MSRELISKKKAAEIVGVDIRTIKRWISEGKLECHETPSGYKVVYRDSLVTSEPDRNTLTITRASRYSGYSTKAIYNWINQGLLTEVWTASGVSRVYQDELPIKKKK
ncbi:MAG: hypothetical protein CEO12_158 [Parcubacteria group bacterium Gr01-1014_46]|nr:MAG: hypothetical protein CEO12_158 [Parcubacteria group bacterium Gr01-1014_46]